tara:strand:- start:400 stop:1050 length:651 start_codon:yes stop_codon:yes gene_type:complete
MKYQEPTNTVKNQDEFSSGLMEAYDRWMGGDTFQNTEIVESYGNKAPQSHGAEIEDTTKKKKTAKKGSYVGQESAPKNEEVQICEKCGGEHPTDECPNILEREEYEIDGEVHVLELIKMEGSMETARNNVGASTCWKGYKAKGTKKKGGKTVPNCVKEEELAEKKLDKVDHSELKGKHADRKDKDIDNDGDVDGSDKYLHMRRKKVSKIIAMKGKK